MSINSTYTGNLYNKEDIDYYSFKLNEDGYFNITLNKTALKEVSGSNWSIKLYCGNEILYTGSTNKTLQTPSFSFQKGKTYYLIIELQYQLFGGLGGIDYAVKVNFKKSFVWEKENNNKLSLANTIKAATSYTGTIYKKDDVNYYQYTAEKSGVLSIAFEKKKMEDTLGIGWNVKVYVNGKQKLSKTLVKDSLKSLGSVTVKKGGKIEIQIEQASAGYSSEYNIPYVIKATYKK